MNHRKRRLAGLLCMGFVLLLALTQVCSIHVLHHHAGGESCAVCQQVQDNQHRLAHTAALGGGSLELPQPAGVQLCTQGGWRLEWVQATLISLKVKLSN